MPRPLNITAEQEIPTNDQNQPLPEVDDNFGITTILPTEDLTDDYSSSEGPTDRPANDLLNELWPDSEILEDNELLYYLPTTNFERRQALERLSESLFSVEEKGKWDTATRKAMVSLISDGYLGLVDMSEFTFDTSETTESNIRTVVVDVERIKNEGFPWTNKKRGTGDYGRVDYADFESTRSSITKVNALARFSQSVGGVISREEYDSLNEGDLQTMPVERDLFYVPDSDPLDIENIRNINSHAMLWEAITTKIGEIHPSVEDKQDATTLEVIMATTVYHPSMGAGERDELGVLNVTFPDGKRKPITGEFFKEYGVSGRINGVKEAVYESPRPYVEANCPELTERTLLVPEDFRGHSGVGGYFEDERLVEREIREKGVTTVDGMVYYLGAKYHNSGHTISKISPEYAAVIKTIKNEDGSESKDIARVLKLAPTEEVYSMPHGKRYRNQTQVEANGFLDPDEFTTQFPESSAVIEHWEDFLTLSNELEKANIPMSSLTLREQSVLFDAFSSGENALEISKYLHESKLSERQKEARIKTLMVVSGNISDTSLVQSISEKEEANGLFTEVSAIANIVGDFEENAKNSGNFSDVELDRIRQVSDMVLRQTTKLFLAAHEVSVESTDISMNDVLGVLNDYKHRVERMHSEFLRERGEGYNRYKNLLNAFDNAEPGSNMQTLLLRLIEDEWEADVLRQSTNSASNSLEAANRIKAFYDGNKELFETAATTTGDTERELQDINDFLDKHSEKILSAGYVVDLACGDRKRLTEPMADMVREKFGDKVKVIAMDIWSPGENNHEGIIATQGAIDSIPLASDSVEAMTINWSPLTDWEGRHEQYANFSELGRVMKVGGVLKTDVAHLEGGEGSWEERAGQRYQSGEADTMGDITVVFPGGREGRFHIYPLSELKAHLKRVGFGELEIREWRTKAGAPRVTIEATFTGEVDPTEVN